MEPGDAAWSFRPTDASPNFCCDYSSLPEFFPEDYNMGCGLPGDIAGAAVHTGGDAGGLTASQPYYHAPYAVEGLHSPEVNPAALPPPLRRGTAGAGTEAAPPLEDDTGLPQDAGPFAAGHHPPAPYAAGDAGLTHQPDPYLAVLPASFPYPEFPDGDIARNGFGSLEGNGGLPEPGPYAAGLHQQMGQYAGGGGSLGFNAEADLPPPATTLVAGANSTTTTTSTVENDVPNPDRDLMELLHKRRAAAEVLRRCRDGDRESSATSTATTSSKGRTQLPTQSMGPYAGGGGLLGVHGGADLPPPATTRLAGAQPEIPPFVGVDDAEQHRYPARDVGPNSTTTSTVQNALPSATSATTASCSKRKRTQHPTKIQLFPEVAPPASDQEAISSLRGLTPVPPGFRFYPTDEELVDYYLRKKHQSFWYLTTPSSRQTRGGEWKEKLNSFTAVRDGPGERHYVGAKKTYEFHGRDAKSKAKWWMNEYYLLDPRQDGQGLDINEDVVLRNVFLKDIIGTCEGRSAKTKSARPPSGKSEVWQNYTKIHTQDPDVVYGACHCCDSMLKAHSKTGTTHLRRHSEMCWRKEQLLEEYQRYLREEMEEQKLRSCGLKPNVGRLDPWHLPSCFTTGHNNQQPSLDTESGFWKEKQRSFVAIRDHGLNNRPVYFAVKKTLEFYQGRQEGKSTKTDWLMSKYFELQPHNDRPGDFILKEDENVMCKVFREDKDVACPSAFKDFERFLEEEEYEDEPCPELQDGLSMPSGQPSSRKRPRYGASSSRKSKVWYQFSKIYNEDGVLLFGVCHACRTMLNAHVKKNGTTSLGRHGKKCSDKSEVPNLLLLP
ncbi:hypothetical protein ACP4OV_023157 [Aristida adscensionis]